MPQSVPIHAGILLGMTSTASIPDTAIASPADTRGDFLKKSGRGYTVVRHIFRQLPDSRSNRVSVLGPMVTARKRRSVQLYLLLLTAWPWLEEQEEPLKALVWARALTTGTGRKWKPSHVSAAWTDLERRGLVSRRRLSRGVVVVPRREDGEQPYTSPGRKKNDRFESYFTLPAEFWTEEWFEKLTLPGLAMLLIIAGETSDPDHPEVWLTNEDAGDWYGLSPRSVEAGIHDLAKHGLVDERTEWTKAPLSPLGATKRHWYSLTGAFATEARFAEQARAQEEVERRKGTGVAPSQTVGEPQTPKRTSRRQPATSNIAATGVDLG
jgi:hypothetical protein